MNSTRKYYNIIEAQYMSLITNEMMKLYVQTLSSVEDEVELDAFDTICLHTMLDLFASCLEQLMVQGIIGNKEKFKQDMIKNVTVMLTTLFYGEVAELQIKNFMENM